MGSEHGLRQEILELAVEVARAGGVAHGSGGGLAVRNPLLAAVQGVAPSCARLYEGGGLLPRPSFTCAAHLAKILAALCPPARPQPTPCTPPI